MSYAMRSALSTVNMIQVGVNADGNGHKKTQNSTVKKNVSPYRIMKHDSCIISDVDFRLFFHRIHNSIPALCCYLLYYITGI
jgi:hypothetical protein